MTDFQNNHREQLRHDKVYKFANNGGNQKSICIVFIFIGGGVKHAGQNKYGDNLRGVHHRIQNNALRRSIFNRYVKTDERKYKINDKENE